MSPTFAARLVRRPPHPLKLSQPHRLLAPASIRCASTAHDSEPDNESYYTNETFASKPMLWTGGVMIGFYALYKVSLENAPAFANDPANIAEPGSTDLIVEGEDERRPWITRYLAYHFAPQTDMYKERNAKNLDAMIESADHRLLANTAQLPVMPRRRSWNTFDDTSPFNREVGTFTEVSDLKVKTYADDRRMPEAKSDDGDEKEGDGDEE